MRQKLHRGRRNVFRRRNPALRIVLSIFAAVAVVAVGFLGAKWFSEHPITQPSGTSAPTVSAPSETPDTPEASDTPEMPDTDTKPDADTTVDLTQQLRGFYLPHSMLSAESLANTTILTEAKAAGFNAVVFDLKDAEGNLYYRFSTATAQQVNSFSSNALSAEQLADLFALLRENGLQPVPRLYAFRDHLGAKALSAARIRHKDDAGWVWYDGNPQSGGKAWLNPYSDEAHRYLIELATELKSAGAAALLLDGVQFPHQTSSASFGSSANVTLKQDAVLSLFVEKVRAALNDCPVILACTGESALGTATQSYGGNPLTFGATLAAPTILPKELPASIKLGETAISNTPETLQQTVQSLVAQMILRTKVLSDAPVIAPFLPLADYTAAQIGQEIAGCLAGGTNSYILYQANGQYEFAAYH